MNLVSLLSLILLGGVSSTFASVCRGFGVPECDLKIDRDTVMIIDASESIDQVRFNTFVLDFVQQIYCAFPSENVNRAAMITFNNEVEVRIPMDTYSRTQWFQAVDTVRNTITLSCCTPMAEAFELAVSIYQQENARDGVLPLVFMLSDGLPFQNTNGRYAFPDVDPGQYTFEIVPRAARNLQNAYGKDTVKVLIIGVPPRSGNLPDAEYFQGIPTNDRRPEDGSGGPRTQCARRNGREFCDEMRVPPFPIASDNGGDVFLFNSTEDDPSDLVNQTLPLICRPLPTVAPTPSPTRMPLSPELGHLDLHFVIDRSRSMTWFGVPELCRNAPGQPDPTASDGQACWLLFVEMAKNIVQEALAYPFEGSTLGWAADFPGQTARGLRVWMYGFACTGHQQIPKAFPIGEDVDSAEAFEAALALARSFIADGGTCPGAAIERSAAMVQDAVQANPSRHFKAAILLSDGVFFDMPRPRLAVKGLHHFNVVTYALGISIVTTEEEARKWNVKPSEVVRQKNQLAHFVKQNEDRLYNFGVNGLNVLDEVTKDITTKLPVDVANMVNQNNVNLETPFWCGWTNPINCRRNSRYCKWNRKNFKCLDKDQCSFHPRGDCEQDRYCRWRGRTYGCQPREGVRG